jgi:hypothetical protein|tara:strand:- start:1005 stop:1130 length:126 start_codon:yes stop_codon:yes gene_type:complete
MVGLTVLAIGFITLWIFIIRDMMNAPEIDKDGNIIEKKKKL